MMIRVVVLFSVALALVLSIYSDAARAASPATCTIVVGSVGKAQGVWSGAWPPWVYWYRLVTSVGSPPARAATLFVATKENIYTFDASDFTMVSNGALPGQPKGRVSQPELFAIPAEETVQLVWVAAVDAAPCFSDPRSALVSYERPAQREMAERLALLPAPSQTKMKPAALVSTVYAVTPCGRVWTPARTLYAFTPQVPAIARQRGDRGIASIRVAVDPDGTVQRATVQQTSGSQWLDDAAVDAAWRSTFAPGVLLCRPIGGDYIFVVEFQ